MKNSLSAFAFGLVAVIALLASGSLITSWIRMNHEVDLASESVPMPVSLTPHASQPFSSSLDAPMEQSSSSPAAGLVARRASVSATEGSVPNAPPPSSAQPLFAFPVGTPIQSATVVRQQAAIASPIDSAPIYATGLDGSRSPSRSTPASTSQALTSLAGGGTMQSASTGSSAFTTPAVTSANALQSAPSVAIPAAFNPVAAGITSPDQQEQAAQIANNFTAQVLASGVAPSSPAYQKVWNTAANQADMLFRQQYGWQAFDAYQRNSAALQ